MGAGRRFPPEHKAIPKVLITGEPGCGKTTLVCAVAEKLSKVRGFHTREIREKGRRVGFSLSLFGGAELVLAHVDIPSRHRAGRYGVDVETFERAVCPEIEAAMEEGNMLVIDEIGRMELFSMGFRDVLLRAVNSAVPLLATVMKRPNPLADKIKARPDVELVELTQHNRDILVGPLVERFRPFATARNKGTQQGSGSGASLAQETD